MANVIFCAKKHVHECSELNQIVACSNNPTNVFRLGPSELPKRKRSVSPDDVAGKTAEIPAKRLHNIPNCTNPEFFLPMDVWDVVFKGIETPDLATHCSVRLTCRCFAECYRSSQILTRRWRYGRWLTVQPNQVLRLLTAAGRFNDAEFARVVCEQADLGAQDQSDFKITWLCQGLADALFVQGDTCLAVRDVLLSYGLNVVHHVLARMCDTYGRGGDLPVQVRDKILADDDADALAEFFANYTKKLPSPLQLLIFPNGIAAKAPRLAAFLFGRLTMDSGSEEIDRAREFLTVAPAVMATLKGLAKSSGEIDAAIFSSLDSTNFTVFKYMAIYDRRVDLIQAAKLTPRCKARQHLAFLCLAIGWQEGLELLTQKWSAKARTDLLKIPYGHELGLHSYVDGLKAHECFHDLIAQQVLDGLLQWTDVCFRCSLPLLARLLHNGNIEMRRVPSDKLAAFLDQFVPTSIDQVDFLYTAHQPIDVLVRLLQRMDVVDANTVLERAIATGKGNTWVKAVLSIPTLRAQVRPNEIFWPANCLNAAIAVEIGVTQMTENNVDPKQDWEQLTAFRLSMLAVPMQ
eukprot:TRINITY_DN9628_c0_g2_i1.p1 TRINITY_DN9628_c0_g2~~TRINITY_DN9628_c0_g2_i1.p1  ORF type:complete len:575 (+),score=73.60 TRINITY_DN9628_c0_g2_i1:67-1791(+)